MFWLPSQSGFNRKEMDWLKHCISQEGTGFRAGCPGFWICLPPCVVFLLRLGASRLKPHQTSQQQTVTPSKRSRGFPELCPKYVVTCARRSRYTCLRVSHPESHQLEWEHRAVSETIPLARHCLTVDGRVKVGKPVVDTQLGSAAHQTHPSAVLSFPDP